jgi:3-mercaptopyruvate sulfurtransferase SseA
MNRLRSLLIFLGLMIIPSLLIACGALAEPTPTVVPQPADRSEVPRISPEELKRRLDEGNDILVIDTRSSGTYNFGHIPGAVMEPDSFDDMVRDQEIITYCS